MYSESFYAGLLELISTPTRVLVKMRLPPYESWNPHCKLLWLLFYFRLNVQAKTKASFISRSQDFSVPKLCIDSKNSAYADSMEVALNKSKYVPIMHKCQQA